MWGHSGVVQKNHKINYALSLRGHGDSQSPKRFRWQVVADRIIGWLDEKGM